MVSTMKT
jgi:hypothetical protein